MEQWSEMGKKMVNISQNTVNLEKWYKSHRNIYMEIEKIGKLSWINSIL